MSTKKYDMQVRGIEWAGKREDREGFGEGDGSHVRNTDHCLLPLGRVPCKSERTE